MEQKDINGFSQTEIYTLYSFLNIYEQEKMKLFKQAELFNKYPCMSEVVKVMDGFEYGERKIKEIENIDKSSITNEFYYTRHCSKPLGVLYHLRNSIAHANICKDGDDVCIEDFDSKTDNPSCTAKGKIPFKVIEDIHSIMQEIK